VATARSRPARGSKAWPFSPLTFPTAEGASAVADSVLKELGGVDILVMSSAARARRAADSRRSTTLSGRGARQNLMPGGSSSIALCCRR